MFRSKRFLSQFSDDELYGNTNLWVPICADHVAANRVIATQLVRQGMVQVNPGLGYSGGQPEYHGSPGVNDQHEYAKSIHPCQCDLCSNASPAYLEEEAAWQWKAVLISAKDYRSSGIKGSTEAFDRRIAKLQPLRFETSRAYLPYSVFSKDITRLFRQAARRPSSGGYVVIDGLRVPAPTGKKRLAAVNLTTAATPRLINSAASVVPVTSRELLRRAVGMPEHEHYWTLNEKDFELFFKAGASERYCPVICRCGGRGVCRVIDGAPTFPPLSYCQFGLEFRGKVGLKVSTDPLKNFKRTFPPSTKRFPQPPAFLRFLQKL